MKVYGLGLIGLLLSLSCLSGKGQVTVEVFPEQQQFLTAEALPVAVRITNRSGQALRLGADEDWLTFGFESSDGRGVAKLGEAPVQGEFVLESSEVATKRVNLQPYFALMEPGRYLLTATVRIKEWNQEVQSAPRELNIIAGAKLWEQEVGIPRAAGATNTAPEVRRYILQQANYLKGQIRLYLRVLDGYGRVVRVFPVGKMISFSRPEPQVDKACNLHVLYQDGPTSFNYTLFDLDGTVVRHQTYEYTLTKPRLTLDREGDIKVTGGARRLSQTDVPPPTDEEWAQTARDAAAALQAAQPTNDVKKPKRAKR